MLAELFLCACQADPDCLSFILNSRCLSISLSQLYDGTRICSWGLLMGGNEGPTKDLWRQQERGNCLWTEHEKLVSPVLHFLSLSAL